MTLPAFTNPGRFWRGNLHTHSTLSDGALDPAEVCRRYKAEGYDFIALTDHFIGLWGYPVAGTKPFRGGGFTTILGAELHSGAQENGELWHILAVGLPVDFAPSNSPDFAPRSDQESAAEIASRAVEAGAFVAIAHPHWSNLTLDDARSVKAAHAVEIYNHGCVVDADRGEGFHTLDVLLNEGRRLNLIATDDAHFHTPDAFGGWVMVKAAENTPEALLAALKVGAFYASTGPELHDVTLDGGLMRVRSSPVDTVIVQGFGNKAHSVWGEGMKATEVPLVKFKGSPYLRVTVVDRAGKRAWSNPIWR